MAVDVVVRVRTDPAAVESWQTMLVLPRLTKRRQQLSDCDNNATIRKPIPGRWIKDNVPDVAWRLLEELK